MNAKYTKLGRTAFSRLSSFCALTNHSLDVASDYAELVSHLETHKGPRRTIELLKQYQLWVRLTTLGLKPEPLPFHKTDASGFPKVFKPWRRYILSDVPQDKQLANTVFTTVRCLFLQPVMDVSTVTSPYTGEAGELEKFTAFCSNWAGVPARQKLAPTGDIKLRSTAGPNGPAVLTSLRDIHALREAPELLKLLRDLAKHTFGPGLRQQFEEWVAKSPPSEGSRHSVLRFIPDKAGKTRVIAIGDYWSQLALLPVHNFFMNLLKSWRTDCTYRQGYLAEVLKDKTSKGIFVGTTDATAFTDRFPTGPQEAIVSRAFGTGVASAWIKLLKERDFSLPDGSTVRYNVGQPMGMFSSWAVCTCTLHALVEYCAAKVGRKRFRDYLILGDDVAVFDSEVYDMLLVTCQKLGIQINSTKSTRSHYSAEMAKREFYKGHEVTGYPLELLALLRSDPIQVLEVVNRLRDLGFRPIQIDHLLTLLPRSSHSKVMPVLTSPILFPGREHVLWPASYEGKVESWNWPIERIWRAFEKANQRLFEREIRKIKQMIEQRDSQSRVNSTGSGLSEMHPLIFGLSSRVEEYLNTLQSLEPTELFRQTPTEGKIYALMFPPVSEVYTHRDLTSRKTHFRGHLLLDALSMLRKNDLSADTGQDTMAGIWEIAFISATVRPGVTP